MTASALPQRSDTRRRVISGVLAGASLLAIGGIASGAFFTDSETIDGNNFQFGALDIATSKSSNLLSTSIMSPGSGFTVGSVDIQNLGTIPLDAFAYVEIDQAEIEKSDSVRLVVTRTAAENCTPEKMAAGTAGTPVYDDVLTEFAYVEQDIPAGTSNNPYCFGVEVPEEVGNEMMGQKFSAKFHFDGTQVEARESGNTGGWGDEDNIPLPPLP